MLEAVLGVDSAADSRSLHEAMVRAFGGPAPSVVWEPPLDVSLYGPDEFPRPLDTLAAVCVRGDVNVLRQPTVAIVGTRSATPYGRAVAWKYAEFFAQRGVCVVSGGAVGIDSEAHKAALAAGGTSVAVLPSPLDKLMPRVNASLFERIAGQGCLVSQFALGSKAMPTWPLFRNKLIVQLADAVVVVEAPGQSGALNSALHASELRRPLFAVPASIELRTFDGSHALIREGKATLAERPEVIADAMGWDGHAPMGTATHSEYAPILEALRGERLTADDLAERLSMEPDEVASSLTMLELEGLVFFEGPYVFARL